MVTSRAVVPTPGWYNREKRLKKKKEEEEGEEEEQKIKREAQLHNRDSGQVSAECRAARDKNCQKLWKRIGLLQYKPKNNNNKIKVFYFSMPVHKATHCASKKRKNKK